MESLKSKFLFLEKEKLIKKQENIFLKANEKANMELLLRQLDKIIDEFKLVDLILDERKRTPVSLRRAATVCLEEYLCLVEGATRENCDMQIILDNAKNKFNLANRNKKPLMIISNFHPENPNLEAEVNNFPLHKYRSTINQILLNKWWILEEDTVIDSFKYIYSEIK